MRILDKQRYWAYFKAYVICFTALVGLYIVIDAFSNFDEFTKRATGAREIFTVMGRFYLVHMSEFYDRLCGVIGMMAAIFTVTWMQKDNELLAMLAAGISTQRVIRPVIVASAIVSTLAVANQELIIPGYAEELQKTHDDDGSRNVRVSGRSDENDIYVHGGEAVRSKLTVFPFNVTFPVEIFGALRELQAKQARYIPEGDRSSPLRGGWLLRGARLSVALDDDQLKQDVLIKLADDQGFPPAVAEIPIANGETYFLRTRLSFQAVTRKHNWFQYASTLDLLQGMTDPVNAADQRDIAVFLHARLLRPFLAMTLLLLSLPQVLGGYGRNMFINLGLSLGTAAFFYGALFVSQYLGSGSHAVIPPEMAAWAPLIGFGTIAVYRWDAIRT